MRKGSLIQVSSPQVLYDCPKDAFTAGFIGAMNFLKGSLTENGVLTIGAWKRRISDLNSSEVGDIFLAVRPEEIKLTELEGIAGVCTDTTFLGSYHQITVQLNCGSQKVRCHISNHEKQKLGIKEGLPCLIQIPEQNVRIFKTLP